MPNLTKRAKWLWELNCQPDAPLKFLSPASETCFCTYCEKSFIGGQKSQLLQHLGSEKHKANKELEKEERYPGPVGGGDRREGEEIKVRPPIFYCLKAGSKMIFLGKML